MTPATWTQNILSLGVAWHFDRDHARQVNRLALRLFDDLQPLHRMGLTERIWLSAAALLHDIAKPVAEKEHHRVGCRIIRKAEKLPLSDEGREMTALLTRYHRGPAPTRNDSCFRRLSRENRAYLVKLTTLLRLADGLDKAGCGAVEALSCRLGNRRVHLDIVAGEPLPLEKFWRKSAYFTQVFGPEVVPHVTPAPAAEMGLDSGLLQTYAV